jgi:hypothetical protein
MATSYTSLLGLALPATGELSGTWGDTVNNYISTYLDSSIAGALTLTADTTLTKTTGSSLGSTSSQYAIIIASPTSAAITITAPAASKIYVVNNTSATYSVTFKASGQSGVVLAVNEKAVLAFNGTDFVKISSSVVATGTVTSVGFTGGLITVATATTTPALTVAGTSGGIVYFASGSTWASTGALTSNALMVGGGAGAGPSTVTTGTGVVTALGVNTGSAGAFVVNGGALGTPSSGTLSSCTVDGTDAVGFRNIPQNAQTGSYTLVLADSGKHIYRGSGGAATWTIPANGSVAYAIGTAITFINLSATSVSIAITTDTMYLSSAGTTGTRTLAQYGSATAIKIASTTWLISGSGLT